MLPGRTGDHLASPLRGPVGNQSTFTDVNNHQTLMGYDTAHNLTDIKDPLAQGGETKLTYDSFHRVTEISYVYNSGTQATYNVHFYYNSSAGPCTASTAVNYTTVSDEDGNQTKYCFDTTGKVVQQIDAKNNSSASATYDANNNMTASTDQNGASSSSTYSGPTGDPYNENQTSFSQPTEGSTVGAQSTAAYNDTAPLDQYSSTSSTSPQGSTFSYTSDGQGDQSTMGNSNNPTNPVTAYYNGNGTLIGLLDGKATAACTPTTTNPIEPVPAQLTECYFYDSLWELTSVQAPAPLGTRSFTYDSLSRVHVATDGKGQTATYGYEKFDRVYNVAYSDGTSVSHNFDADGNVQSLTDATGCCTNYYYDLLNRLNRKQLPGGGYNFYMQHDGVGNLTQVTDDAGTTYYTYDATNDLHTVKDPAAQTTTYTVDSRGNRHVIAYANGTTITQSFDASDRVTEIKVTSSNSTVLEDLQYSYLKGGTTDTNLRYSVTDTVAGTSTAYTYDSQDRLTEAKTTGGSGADYKYSYDANSNLCRTDGAACTPSTDSYKYNAANELCSVGGTGSGSCSSPPTGSTTYSYDANGNVTAIGSTTTLAYNAQDQMTSSTISGTQTTYGYSGTGQSDRVQVGSTTFHTTPLGIDCAHDATGTTHDVRDNAGNLIEEVLPSGAHEYYVFDALGSVTGVTDGSASLIDSYHYDPYGNLTASTGTTANPWKYGAAYTDATTGFDHMGARYYSPTVQRWTQIDPVNNPSDAHGWNRYFFVGDDPVNYADPTGRCGLSDIGNCLGDIGGYLNSGIGVVTVGGIAIGAAAFLCSVPCGVALFIVGSVAAVYYSINSPTGSFYVTAS